ncbi:MAG: DNA polymerase III subunit delta [Bacteroidales bacterium]|nr:DNA polymerase III subunit delta [Bacteroidales bacterium]
MKFTEVIGQEEVKQKLVKTVKTSRVSHAQLFLGPPGSGKLALAIAYAQFINCKNKTGEDACGECPSCIKYAKLAHPDLHFIYPTATVKGIDKPMSKDFIAQWRELLLENNAYISLSDWHNKIGIEKKQSIINARDCNEIIKTLSYKSFEAEYKVMVIWMAEKLFHSAAPKILKILEEPPDRTLFILISENQDQVINTILSRTQLVKIPRIEDDVLSSYLINKNHEPSVVHDVVRIANGDFLQAKFLISNRNEEAESFSLYVKWMRLCYKNSVDETIGFVNEVSKYPREKQKNLLNFALRMTREGLLLNLGVGQVTKLNRSESDFMKKFHQFINNRNGEAIINELNQSIYHIERNANAGILFLDLSLKIGKMIKA